MHFFVIDYNGTSEWTIFFSWWKTLMYHSGAQLGVASHRIPSPNPKSMDVILCKLNRWEHGSWDLPLHTGSQIQVPSMTWMPTWQQFWMWSLTQLSTQVLRFSFSKIKIRLERILTILQWFVAGSKSWDYAPMLGLVDIMGTWDLRQPCESSLRKVHYRPIEHTC